MITGELKNKIDRLWLEFWQGGITNPLTVIMRALEQEILADMDALQAMLDRPSSD